MKMMKSTSKILRTNQTKWKFLIIDLKINIDFYNKYKLTDRLIVKLSYHM
jgi:hypothetical protein